MRVLITRPRPDADTLARRLHTMGHTTIVEPLIDIAFIDGPPLDLTSVQALVFTSANGVRAVARRKSDRTRPVIAVGPATASEARALGFTDVTQSRGEGVEGLTAHIAKTLDPSRGALLHATGTVTTGDLAGALKAQGFKVRVERLYDARAADNLSGALTSELAAGMVDAALFFSPRTAALFTTLIRAANLDSACAKMTAYVLSQAVATALSPLVFARVSVSPRATAESMLEQLKNG